MILIALSYINIETDSMSTHINIFESKFKIYTIWTTFKTWHDNTRECKKQDVLGYFVIDFSSYNPNVNSNQR